MSIDQQARKGIIILAGILDHDHQKKEGWLLQYGQGRNIDRQVTHDTCWDTPST
jgi:hypothetical protein